jgi:hypothetical protein
MIPTEPDRPVTVPGGDPIIKPGLGLAIDDRPYVGGDRARIADAEFTRRAGDHRQDAVRDIALDAQQSQRGTPLPSGPEGGGQHIIGHLLEERGRIGDYGVDAAGFGDQRDDRPRLGRARG